jgi:hypothetical protein
MRSPAYEERGPEKLQYHPPKYIFFDREDSPQWKDTPGTTTFLTCEV